MKRYYILFLLLISSVLMTACGDIGQAKESDLTESQVKMLDSLSKLDTEKSYMQQVNDFTGKLGDYVGVVHEPIYMSKVNDTNKEKLIEETNNFIFAIKEFNPTPNTKRDYSLDPYIQELKYESEMAANYALQYIHKKDGTYRSLYEDSMDNILIIVEQLNQISNQNN